MAYLQNVKTQLGIDHLLAKKDVYAEAVDLSGGAIACDCGVAYYLAIISALQNRRAGGGMIVIGDLTVQGNIKGVLSLIEPLSISMENGAIQALIPMTNKTQFTSLPEEVIEKVDLVFYGDPDRAVAKGLE